MSALAAPRAGRPPVPTAGLTHSDLSFPGTLLMIRSPAQTQHLRQLMGRHPHYVDVPAGGRAATWPLGRARRTVNYPRRQQYRRARRAVARGAASIVVLGVALVAVTLGMLSIALLVLVVAIGLALHTPLGPPREAQPGGSPIRGAGAARAGTAGCRGLATAALDAVAGPRRHGQRGDRTDRDRPSRSRPKPEHSTTSTSPACTRWRGGWAPAAGVGAQPARSRCCVWFTRAGSNGSKRTC